MIADRIKFLREQKGYAQAELAKKLGITRSSVNAWELGISVPSTQYIVELSNIFSVSTDYLLGVEKTSTIDASGLTEQDKEMVYKLTEYLKSKNLSWIEKIKGYSAMLEYPFLCLWALIFYIF